MIKKNFLKLILACGIASSFSVLAQQDNSYIAPLADDSLLLDIAIAANDQLFVVGERGHILSSSNGVDWTQQQVPTESTLTAVHFEGDEGWAVGHDSVILYTSDSGANWQVQQFLPGLEKPLLDVLFLDDKRGIAIGAYGTYFETQDAGSNWETVQHATLLSQDDQEYLEEIKAEDEAFYLEELGSILPHLNRIHRSGDKLYIAGESGLLAVSDNWGKSWSRLEVNYYGSFFDIANVENNGLYAAGLRGNVFRLDEAINRWVKIPSTGELSFNSLIQLPNNKLLAVGNNGASLMINHKNKTTYAQTEEGIAIVNGVWFNNQLVTVTAQGVKVQALDYLGDK